MADTFGILSAQFTYRCEKDPPFIERPDMRGNLDLGHGGSDHDRHRLPP